MNRVLLTALFLAGCGSDVTVDGEVGGLSFDLKTAFGWIDATDTELDIMAGKVLFTQRDEKPLNVVLSGARFDPNQDIRFMSVEQFFEMRADEERNGLITMRVSNSESLANGAVLTDPSPGGGAPELNASHELGLVRVKPDD